MLGSICHGKHVHNEPTRRGAPWRDTFWPTVITKHLPTTDIEAIGGDQTRDNGKFTEQIVGGHEHISTGVTACFDADLHRMLVINRGQQQHVDGNLWCGI